VNRLLSEKGFDAMTVDEVAAEVGIAKASLYKHFNSKEELACAAMVQAMQKAQAFLENLDQQTGADLSQATPNASSSLALNKLMATTRWTLELKLAGQMPTLPSQNSRVRAPLMASRPMRPGGKAALLHNLLQTNDPNDTFLANEPTAHRAELVARVVPKAKIVSFDGRDWESFGEKFDRILIDAPCSGLGALRRRPEARWRRSLNDLKELLPLQRELIDSAYEMLNPGGIIGFATCSPLLAETKSQVLDAKYRHKNLEILDISKYSPAGSTGVNPDGSLQLWTHLDGSDSMFMALLQKPSE
jgi:AcrR family transcriptional regulator